MGKRPEVVARLPIQIVNDIGRYHSRRTDQQFCLSSPIVVAAGHLRVAAQSRNREDGSGRNRCRQVGYPVDLGETNDERRFSQRFHWLLEERLQYLKQWHLECVRLEVYLRCKQ